MRVLVTGGTGVVGKPAVDHLLKRGHTVRLLSRNADRDARQWSVRVEPFAASLGDEEAVQGAAEGCEVVLHVAGIVAESPPEVTFERVNVEGTRQLVREAERAGVRRFVYVSSLGADRGASDYHRSKLAAEEVVRGFRGEWLVVRPGNVYGPGDEVISLLLKMVRTLPAIPVVGNGNQPFQPVWADDLGLALTDAVQRDDLHGQTLEIAGPEVTTTNEVLDRLERLTGQSPVRVPVPEFVAQAGAGVAEALGLPVPVNSDQLTMLAEGNVIEPPRVNALTEVFGITPIPLDEGLSRLADSLPERLPREGTGALFRHRYWADIRGSQLDARTVFPSFCREFRSLTDGDLMRVGVEPGAGDVLEAGMTLTLAIPMRGNVQVRVEYVEETEAAAVTLEGHPLSGAVRFMARDLDGLVRFEVRTYTRSSNLIDRVAMAAMGEPLKNAAWRNLVEAVARRSGGELVDEVHSEAEALDAEAAAKVERWIEEVVMQRLRMESESRGSSGKSGR